MFKPIRTLIGKLSYIGTGIGNFFKKQRINLSAQRRTKLSPNTMDKVADIEKAIKKLEKSMDKSYNDLQKIDKNIENLTSLKDKLEESRKKQRDTLYDLSKELAYAKKEEEEKSNQADESNGPKRGSDEEDGPDKENESNDSEGKTDEEDEQFSRRARPGVNKVKQHYDQQIKNIEKKEQSEHEESSKRDNSGDDKYVGMFASEIKLPPEELINVMKSNVNIANLYKQYVEKQKEIERNLEIKAEKEKAAAEYNANFENETLNRSKKVLEVFSAEVNKTADEVKAATIKVEEAKKKYEAFLKESAEGAKEYADDAQQTGSKKGASK